MINKTNFNYRLSSLLHRFEATKKQRTATETFSDPVSVPEKGSSIFHSMEVSFKNRKSKQQQRRAQKTALTAAPNYTGSI